MLQNLSLIKHDFQNSLITDAVVCPAIMEDGYNLNFIKTDDSVLTLSSVHSGKPRLFKTLDSAKRVLDSIGFRAWDFVPSNMLRGSEK